MANPKNHFKAFFFRLGELCESEELKPFSCLPLQRSFIPAYITIDILIRWFTDKLETWGPVVDLNRKAFNNQGVNKYLQFQDIVEHIEELTKDDLNQTTGRCVFIDPGRRNLMYCIKETFIFAKNNRSKLSRHFRPSNIEAAENILSRTYPSSVNLDKLVHCIEARPSGNEIIDKKRNLYYGHLFVTKLRGYFPRNSTLPDATANFTEEVFELTEEIPSKYAIRKSTDITFPENEVFKQNIL
ncbi:MAG: hypothetical protein EXX96DRAFT_596476 [Benjaminiella poitrasii]|nr:MAG: hypothetical protein EXX96DRAFT_596476 [Benjaminiella poitrasii]